MKIATLSSLLAGCLLSLSVQAQTYDFYVTNNTNAQDSGPWVSVSCKRANFFSGASFSGIFKQQPNEQLAYSFSSDEGWLINDYGTWTCTATKGFKNGDSFNGVTEPSTVVFEVPKQPSSVIHLTIDGASVLNCKVD